MEYHTILTGPGGSGKTSLALTMVTYHTTLFIPSDELMRKLKSKRGFRLRRGRKQILVDECSEEQIAEFIIHPALRGVKVIYETQSPIVVSQPYKTLGVRIIECQGETFKIK